MRKAEIEQHKQTIRTFLSKLTQTSLLRVQQTPQANWIAGVFYKEYSNGKTCRCLIGIVQDWKVDQDGILQSNDNAAISPLHHKPSYEFDALYLHWGPRNTVNFIKQEAALLLTRKGKPCLPR